MLGRWYFHHISYPACTHVYSNVFLIATEILPNLKQKKKKGEKEVVCLVCIVLLLSLILAGIVDAQMNNRVACKDQYQIADSAYLFRVDYLINGLVHMF